VALNQTNKLTNAIEVKVVQPLLYTLLKIVTNLRLIKTYMDFKCRIEMVCRIGVHDRLISRADVNHCL